jgi:hypothetical protein
MVRPAALVLFLFVPHVARADGPITDGNYAIDAHRGAAVADYRVIGMGGVSLATAKGALGDTETPSCRSASGTDVIRGHHTQLHTNSRLARVAYGVPGSH